MILVDKKIAADISIQSTDCVYLRFLSILSGFFPLPLDADEVDSEDSAEPPQKRLCLSPEDEQNVADSTPCISVVALPRKSVSNRRLLDWALTCTSQVASLGRLELYLVKKICF